jgi:hypothetical protein
MNVKYLIDFFKNHLTKLNNGNLVIGGITALNMHGLNMHREAVDFDIIIYNPTSSQEEYLEHLIEKEQAIDNHDEEGVSYRSYKVTIEDKTIDFLMERDLQLPKDLLQFQHGEIKLYVQSIQGVISAKESYFNGFKHREKDIEDCKLLKENNFNLKIPANYSEYRELGF